ncbi:MAG: hypothetical protein ACJZ59_07105 [Candidatus Thalassarchaeaceae archaeon]
MDKREAIHPASMRRLTSILLGLLFLGLSAAPILSVTASQNITSNTVWSGSHVVDQAVIVAQGATLTIAAGADIEVSEDVTITIQGNLVIEGTENNPSEIYGTFRYPTSDRPVWQGFRVDSSGSAVIGQSSITHSRGGFDVAGDLSITAGMNPLVEGAQIGYRIDGGSLSVPSDSSLRCTDSAIACLSLASTSAEVPLVEATNSSAIVLLNPDGNLTALELIGDDIGIGVQIHGGANLSVTHLNLTDANVGVSQTGAADTWIGSIHLTGENGIVVDWSSSSGGVIDNIVTTSGGTVREAIHTEGVVDGFVANVTVTGSGVYPALHLGVDGSIDIHSFTGTGFSEGVMLRGSGTANLDEVDLSVSNRLIDTIGAATLHLSNSDWVTTGKFGTLASASSILIGVNMSGTSAVEDGLELITGDHHLENVLLERPYTASDRASTGLRCIWSDTDLTSVQLIGWHRGAVLEQDAHVTARHLNISGGGRDGGTSVMVDGGSFQATSLHTEDADHGIEVLNGSSLWEDGPSVHIDQWTAADHRDITLLMSDETSVTVRNLPTFQTTATYDAFGDGLLFWGGSSSGRVSVSESHHLIEHGLIVQDLGGQAVFGAEVESLGFNTTSATDGSVTLPILETGHTAVTATSGGIGTTQMTDSSSSVIQIPLLPTSGDWRISSGNTAILQDGNFTIPGDLIIESGAALYLVRATLMLNSNTFYTSEGGQLFGEDGSIIGGAGSHGSVFPPLAYSGDLTVDQPVEVNCTENATADGNFLSTLTIGPSCTLTVHGSVNGDVILSTGASVLVESPIRVRILDRGFPVEGATVIVSALQMNTASDGTAEGSVISARYEEIENIITGTVTIVVRQQGIESLRSWDTSGPFDEDISVSTLDSGTLTGWTRIEPQFSPVHLLGDLVVPAGVTLQILPQASLRIGSSMTVDIQGNLDAEDATITGYDWLSLRISGDGMIRGTQITGGPIDVASDGELTVIDSVLNGAPIDSTGSSQVTVQSSRLLGSSTCLSGMDQSVLNVQDTTFESCYQQGILAFGSIVEFTDITLESGNGRGIWLQSANGNVTNLESSEHTGKAALLLEDTGDLRVRGGTFNASLEPALMSQYTESLDIVGGHIIASTGVMLEESSGIMEAMIFDGGGTGAVGLRVDGSTSRQLTLRNLSFNGWAHGIELIGDKDDLENPAVRIEECDIDTIESISSVSLPFLVISTTLTGSVNVSTTAFSFEAALISSMPAGGIEVIEPATVRIAEERRILLQDQSGNALDSGLIEYYLPEFHSSLEEQSAIVENGNSVILYHRVVTQDFDLTYPQVQLDSTAGGYLSEINSVEVGDGMSSDIVIQMDTNTIPTITITQPANDQVTYLGDEFLIEVQVTDPDMVQAGALMVTYEISEEGSSDSQQIGSETGFPNPYAVLSNTVNPTELGTYTLTVSVRDPAGGVATDSVIFQVWPQDNDNDFIDTCQTTGDYAWYDPVEEVRCGPDEYDEDDDNDGMRDTIDVFPKDPCAWQDTDEDGKPDDIVASCATVLIEDDDDDNDGLLDRDDSDPKVPLTVSESTSEDSLIVTLLSPGVVLPLLVIVIVTALLARQRRNSDG